MGGVFPGNGAVVVQDLLVSPCRGQLRGGFAGSLGKKEKNQLFSVISRSLSC